MPPITDVRRLEAVVAVALLLAVIGIFTGAAGLHIASVVVLAVGLLSKTLSWALAKGWWTLGFALGKVTGTVFLALVFFLVVTPVGLVMRLARRLSPELRWRSLPAELAVREHEFSAADLDNPW